MVEVPTGQSTTPQPFEDIHRARIKIIKNTKGYNWEISLPREDNQSIDDWVKDVSYINTKMEEQYGNKEDIPK